jgi:hypothetical protein
MVESGQPASTTIDSIRSRLGPVGVWSWLGNASMTDPGGVVGLHAGLGCELGVDGREAFLEGLESTGYSKGWPIRPDAFARIMVLHGYYGPSRGLDLSRRISAATPLRMIRARTVTALLD